MTNSSDYQKWRLCYEGGTAFINNYLVRFSKREDDTAFKERKQIAYNPAFAKSGINKLKNTFYSRMSEIARVGGDQTYRDAIFGKDGGVDLFGNSMNAFMGQDVLTELMTMRRVGIFVDKPGFDGNLLANNKKKRPYIYLYCAEDILSWNCTYIEGEYIYTNVLLRDNNYGTDQKTGLVTGNYQTYRHIWLADDGNVHIQIYKEGEKVQGQSEIEDVKVGEETILPMGRIPFVILELQESLLCDVADYQIGMMNIASADMNYCYKANFPFYTEQFDAAATSAHQRGPSKPLPGTVNPETGKADSEGTAAAAQRSDQDEVSVGAMRGRRYPKGLDRPDFIAPPTEPLLASIKKQEQMKQEIYELIDIAASNAQPTHASAESKSLDDRGLESGLSYIGLELEYGEREVAKIWAIYQADKAATVNYPSKYQLKSDAQRTDEAKSLKDLKAAVPSKMFSKEVSKVISRTLLAEKVKPETLEAIDKEIDAANYVTSDSEVIKTASELGLVQATTASNALGFDGEKEVPKAQEESAKRLANIAAAQSAGAARGVPDDKVGQDQEKIDKLGKEKRGEANGAPA